MSADPASDAIDAPGTPFVYVFVNRASPIAVLNLQITGTFISPVYAAIEQDREFSELYRQGRADFLPFVPNTGLSTNFMSPFTARTLGDYRVEWDAEVTRKHWFPEAPSRLTAIFAFENWEDCERVNHQYRWPLEEVRRFRVAHELRRRRVNMEIVSLARLAYNSAMLDADSVEHLWRSYWSGASEYVMDLSTADARGREIVSTDAIWELLIDGRLDLDRSWPASIESGYE
jgi:hypothetical protein